MNKDQRAHLDSYKRIQSVETAYATEIATMPEYAFEKTITDALVIELDEAEAKQQEAGGEAEVKADFKKAMAEVVIKYALRGSVKSRQLGTNLYLASALEQAISYIYGVDDTLALAHATDLRNLLHDNLATLTNINTANIAEIDAAITAYNNSMALPIASRQERKAQGTDLMDGLITNLSFHSDEKYKLIQSYFAGNELENAYALAHQLINTGIRHNKLDVSLTNVAGEPIIAGSLVITNAKGAKPFTVSSAVTEIIGLSNGMNHIVVTSPGYVSAAIDFKVIRSVTNEVTIRLTAV